MRVIGLTGSIAMGKSTLARAFERARVPVFDADATVHQLFAHDARLIARIEARFPGVTTSSGVDRCALGAKVLEQPAALRALERLVHPAIGQARTEFLRRTRAHRFVVVDVPLLFEKRLNRGVDAVVLVSAPAWVQRARALRRPGLTGHKLRAIRRAQWTDAAKRKRANIIVPTCRAPIESRRHVVKLVQHLRACSKGYCDA